MMVDPFIYETDAAPSGSAVQSPLASGVVVCIAVVALISAWVAPAAQAQSTPPLVQGPADLIGVDGSSSSVADVDDDGNLDVLVAGLVKSATDVRRTATLYLGTGDGTFSEAGVGLTDVSSASTAIGDVDNDGNADLLITGETSAGTFGQTLTTELYLGNGDGTFTRANASLTGIDDGAAAIADVNNDGNDDLILTGNTGTSSDEASTILYLSNGDGTFNETSTSLTDVYESAVAVGDVDGDSNVDVVISGNGGSGLFYGNGDGTFTQANATPSNLALLDGAASIADIDGDGNKDFFLVGKRPFQSPRALVYYGDGSGGFTQLGTTSTGLRAAELAAAGVADVDGDGNRDVIIAGLDGTSPFATVFRSNGDRTFSSGSSTLPATQDGSIAIADFYNDGDPDVLITGSEEGASRVSELFINNTKQSGPNRAPTVVQDLLPDTLAAGQTLTDTVEARDPDGDPVTLQASGATPNVSTTALDDATLEVQFAPSRVQAGRTPSLSVQADDGQGASTILSADVRVSPFFARLPSSGLEDNSLRNGDAPTADVNGDGRTDVFVGATATLYLGQEDGTLQNANASLGPGNRRDGVAADFGDVNNDGTPDLVKAFDDPNGDVVTTLYLGNGDGTFNEATGATLTGVENGAVTVADVNNDDNDDVLVTGDSDDSRVSETPSTTIYISNGDGTFSTPGSSGLTDFVGDDIAVGAVDGDGNPDVLIVGGSPTELYLGNGDGTFQEDTPFTFPTVDNGSAAIADATGDGTADVLIAGSEFGSPTTTLFVGNGDGSFSESSAGFPGIETGTAGVVDVNGDDTPDVFVAGDASASAAGFQTRVYLSDGSGGFSVAGAGIEGVRLPPVAFGDYDGDGDEDLVLPSLNGLQAGPLYQNLTQERTPSTTVTKTISSGGTADFGATGAALTFSSVSSAGDVTVERFDSAPFTPSGISQSNVSEYRLVVEPSGGLRFSSVEVRLSASAFSGIDDPTAVQLYKRPTDGTSEFTGLQTSVEDQGTADISDDVIVASTSSLSEFVLASDTQPLPVELAGFDAEVSGESVRLTWQTASESGNAGFAVQRRVAGSGEPPEWTKVGYREGAGTTSQPRAYRFTDTDLPYEADRLAYRLKQVDTDGTASYSEEVTVRRGVDELTLLGTSPNPARQRATVRFAVPERQEVTVRLYDVLGRRVRTAVRRTAEGRQETRLDVGDLSSGVYFLRLRAGGEVRTQKLTVVR